MALLKAVQPLPTRQDVTQYINETKARLLAAAGLTEQQVGIDVRVYGRTVDDLIERIGVGCNLHQDARARSQFEMVDVKHDPNWMSICEQKIQDIIAEIGRLERRRDAFDPDRTWCTPPKWAWDIHPTAASILSLYRRLPRFDGTHRIDSEHGRLVNLGSAPGVKDALVAYGDGIIRIVSAEFPGGSSLVTRDDRIKVIISDMLPDVIENSLLRRPATVLGAQLANGKYAHLATITNIKRSQDPKDKQLEITLRDILIPWDARTRRGEDWRITRMNEK